MLGKRKWEKMSGKRKFYFWHKLDIVIIIFCYGWLEWDIWNKNASEVENV